MEQIARERTYPELVPLHPPRLRLSPLLLIVFALLVGFTVVSLGVRAVAQYTLQPFNPFPAYADIFPGQPARAIETRAFLCRLNYNYYHDRTEDHDPIEEWCTFIPAAGVFSSVTVFIADGMIRETIFLARHNSFTVGELAIWLEAPVIHKVPKVIYLVLPQNLVRAITFGHAERFSLFHSVPNITISLISPAQ